MERMDSEKQKFANPIDGTPESNIDSGKQRQLGELPQPVARPPEYFDRYYKDLDRKNTKREVRNRQSGATVEITLDANRRIAVIKPIFHENPEEAAEQLRELVRTTDENGEFTHKKLTRREAREQNERYLIVSALIFHNGKLLAQKRSGDKDIDPNKLSTSAHGVAREIIYEFTHGIDEPRHTLSHETEAILNTVLEIFEELYHNYDPEANQPTPAVRIWPGTKAELDQYAERYKIDEPNTIYLITKVYLPDDGYPLGDHQQKRSRGISFGYIFSQNAPEFSFDPHELSAVEEYRPVDLIDHPDASEDLKRLLKEFAEEY